MEMKSRECHGSVLISFLIILALLTLLSAEVTDRAILSFTLAQQEKHSLAAEKALRDALLKPSASSTLLEESVTYGGKRMTGSVSYTLPAGPLGKTLYQLTEHFKGEELCTKDSLTISEPPTLLPLSPYSPRQRNVCKQTTLSLTTDHRTLHSAVFGTMYQEAPSSTLVVHGYLVIPETLSLKEQLIIIAGGDVWIQRITTGASSSNVEILSLNGGITVTEVGEGVTIAADANTYLDIPTGIASKTSLTGIPKSLGWISGLYLGAETK